MERRREGVTPTWSIVLHRCAVIFLLAAAVSALADAQTSSGLRVDEHPAELVVTGGQGEAPAMHAVEPRVPGAANPHGDVSVPQVGGDVAEEPSEIPSRELLRTMVQPTGGTGIVPPSARPDTVGAFRFICQPGQVSYDDPIVFPGQPGKSHLHQWFGNTTGDAYSTYETLRSRGSSTCMNTANRSAYWMPAMLDGRGHVVRPDYVTIYYKRHPASSPDCLRMAPRGCTGIPRGLRMIFGYDMITHRPSAAGGYFNCDGPGAKSAHYRTITEAAQNCPAGARLGAIINAPDCWDGQRLDSPNHRDHMATASYGSQGFPRCPSTHPYVIPAFTMGAWYTVDDAGAASWYLSSDDMPGMGRMTAGSTFHADWFGAWDDKVMKLWTDNCIDKMLNCSGGDLGNGQQLVQQGPFEWKTSRRLVEIPARGRTVAQKAEHH